MHVPVLKNEILDAFEYLAEINSPSFVDGTLGAGGHSLAIAHKLKMKPANQKVDFTIIGIDRDEEALETAKTNIKKAGLENNFILIHNSFKNIGIILKELGIDKIDGALLDLGVSLMQLDRKERGFSFQHPDEPLDMRMDQTQQRTAKDVVNSYPERELAEIIRNYGEERFAQIIASKIVAKRKGGRIRTVGGLLPLILEAIPRHLQKKEAIHPATRTFQALRIEVNEELKNLDQAIKDIARCLAKDGKLAVISFHSLEDRIVKKTFLGLANPCQCPKDIPCVCGLKPEVGIITKKPIVPGEDEIKVNPRSRSAKLRILQKII